MPVGVLAVAPQVERDRAVSVTRAYRVNLNMLALVALCILLRRRRPEDIAVAGLLASAFVVTASFFVISIACDYRYLYFLDLAAIAGALAIASFASVAFSSSKLLVSVFTIAPRPRALAASMALV